MLRSVLLMLLLVPSLLAAQVVPDTARSLPDSAVAPAVFTYLQYGDTVGFEAVRSDSGMVRGIYLVPKQGRIGWDHQVDSVGPSSLLLTLYPGEGPILQPVREMQYTPRGDSMLVITRDPQQNTRDMRATTAGALPAFSRSMTHLAYLAFHAIQTKRRVLPLFLTSSGKTVDATVDAFGETIMITVDGLRVEADWADGALLEIRVPSQGLVVKRAPAS